ncbi:unnamed protein product [Paramecium pentaurelia]|uniref:PIPK domain-containing protein n=1 Tax=Paramecium pentaurelia TaxID=43138 RepID=A0A8S1TUJ7_9CILI|nr:unnamed protein product [Paramecium pentaurelia]
MDKVKKTSWEKITSLLQQLYSVEQQIQEQHVTIQSSTQLLVSLFHAQFRQLIDREDIIDSLLQLDFETPQLFNMGRNLQSEFAFTLNHKYILKVVSGTQYRYFKNTFHQYYFKIIANKNCLLARTFGIYKLEDRENKSYFVLMENLFYEHKLQNSQIISIYDLKGAQSSRITKNFDEQFQQQQQLLQTKAQTIPLLKGKDEDFKKIRFFQDFSNEKKLDLMNQIKQESDILAEANTMDYSLMIITGYINQCQQGNRLIKLSNNVGTIIGIIDYYQEYNSTKKLENKFKTWFGMHKPDQQISCVDSDTYRKRFQIYFQQFLQD